MRKLCFLFVLGLFIAGPSFDTFAAITQDLGLSKSKAVHFMDAKGRGGVAAPSHMRP